MKEQILQAKLRLYKLLMDSENDELSDNEIELLYKLSKDEQVNKWLSKRT